MLRESNPMFQLPIARGGASSCSQFLDSRELPHLGSARAALLLKEEQSFHNLLENHSSSSWPLPGLSVRGISILRGSNDAACVEQLLVHCATALESNDTTLAQQIMWVLNNIASVDGDPNQRVAAWFLRALVSRASRIQPSFSCMNPASANSSFLHSNRVLTPTQLAKFVDLTPWHRFGFSAANGAILEAFEGKDRVHIIDFSITHCMQWPTLIESLSVRPDGPPSSVRLSVHISRPSVPPFIDMSYDELGHRLCMFARSKKLPFFQFNTIFEDAEFLDKHMLDIREDEALAVNCQLRLHYISDDDHNTSSSRDRFLKMVKSLEPNIVTMVEEDSNLGSNSLVTRLKSAFNQLWIPFDLLESCLPRTHDLRMQYEADVGRKIENIIACEGAARIERPESREQWMERMRAAEFKHVPFSDDVAGDVKRMLEQHATGWGLKKEEDAMVLTWKGHNAVFATSWV